MVLKLYHLFIKSTTNLIKYAPASEIINTINRIRRNAEIQPSAIQNSIKNLHQLNLTYVAVS